MTVRLAVLACLVAPAVLAQPAEIESEPPADYLVQVTRQWAERSPLADLRTKPFGSDEIELRVWGGYGLFGTRGAVLQRAGGEWRGFTVWIDQHRAAGTDSLAAALGALPPCVVGPMSSRCVVGEVGYKNDGVLYDLDCPRVADMNRLPEAYAGLWDGLVEAGVLTLPPTSERNVFGLDGHSYVVEVRVGVRYRASSFWHSEPEEESERAVQEIARRLTEFSGVPLFPSWGE